MITMLGKTKGNCYNYGGETCQARPDEMTDFETYLINRLDELETQLSDKIAELDKKVSYIYAFATGISCVVGFLMHLLSNFKG